MRNLEPPGAARNDEAREAARTLGSKRQQAEVAFQKPVSERDVADAVVRRAAEEAAATPLIGSRRLSSSAKLCFFLVALAVAALPAAHRRVHGVEVFGGRERVTLCIDQLMPEAVINLVGFAKCSKLVAEVGVVQVETGLTHGLKAAWFQMVKHLITFFVSRLPFK